ncbi:ABC transporter permease [Emticicia agri]|uniref:ABC transporter permease n=1 Tax=Emticicia agri TaxID=2492393 RepID=A0A4Q5M5C6_9BACT|nr:ABC transporter permease [Emticicia agri]RYU97591.1 ABC transporter permease [Emticicia agri]
MLRNYFKIAFRSLWKNKLFSFINIVGLGLAMTFGLIGLMQIQNVFEFDNFHPYPERTYRILTDFKNEKGKELSYATSPFLLAEKLKNDYGFVEKSARVIRFFSGEMNNRIKNIRVNGIYVDPSFFDIFGFPLEKGSYPVAPNTVVLNHETAVKFFGTTNPVGKTITHPDFGVFTITGVLKPYKYRGTHFRSDLMVSMATFANLNKDKPDLKDWSKFDTYTFILVNKSITSATLDRALATVAKDNKKETDFGKTTHAYRRQALKDISPDFERLEKNAYVDDVFSLSVNFLMSLVIIILAGFNYTNLTLARSLSRAREVGVRKVSGAVRGQLVSQFLIEAIVLAFFALLIAYGSFVTIKQYIHLSWIVWEVDDKLLMWGVFGGFTLLTGIIAGVFPARILSGFQPAKVLKGELGPGTFGKLSLRKSLIVIQFVVTLIYMALNVTMYSQFEYMATENENFNRKNILNITLAGNDYQLLKNELSHLSGVQTIGLTSATFGSGTSQYAIKAKRTDENSAAHHFSVDKSFIDNMKLTLLAGSNLPDAASDSTGRFVLLNEKAVKTLHLGTPQEAIGKMVLLNNETEVTVAGILKDFCFANYEFAVTPAVFQYNPQQFHILSVKIADAADETTLLASVEKIWKRYHPYEAMVYSWYAQELYERYFPGEDMQFSGITILVGFVIAIMGLLGMVTYSTEKRIKEIGIRKVLGASASEVIRLLSWSFLKLLLIAALIAFPISYLSSVLVLNIFTFNPGINAGLLIGSFGIIFLIALFTIGFKTYQAALSNPVESLKVE